MRCGRIGLFLEPILSTGFTLTTLMSWKKCQKDMASLITGKVSALTQSLQETYAGLGIPRHPKKGVARQHVAEVQGAIVDGAAGLAYPKPGKVMRYLRLAQLLLLDGSSSQKQMQVVGWFLFTWRCFAAFSLEA